MTIPPPSVLAFCAGSWMSFATCAEPTLVKWYRAEHDTRSEDPAAQGWTRVSDRSKSAVAELIDGVDPRGPRAWRLVDDDAAGVEDLYYFSTLAADQMEVARSIGFSCLWRLRIPDDTGGVTRAISTEVCVASKGGDRLRFGVQMGRTGNGFVASIFAGTRGVVSGSVSLPNADDFHTWVMLFDGLTGTLNLFVADQIVLSTRFDHSDKGHNLVFGSRSTGTGASEWNLVEFYTGLLPGLKIIPPPVRSAVFVSGTEGYHTFRIPALVATPEGTLLAFCEGRKKSRSDYGDIDLVLKRSTDGGGTWGPLELIHEEGGDARINVGNPTVLIDRDTGVIWLVMLRLTTSVLVSHSTDDGRSWSKPVDITGQVKAPAWKFYAVGPGIGIQIRSGPHKGRLVVPAYHRETANKSGPAFAHVFYSDDHGKSWQIGGTVGPHTCECQLVETVGEAGSELLINARNHWARSGGRPELAGKRIVARSRDGGTTWSEPAFDAALMEPTCQASILRYSGPDPGSGSRILFANPASRGRNTMTVRVSYDGGRTWPLSRLVDSGPSAYSCLATLPDGRIGLLYEAGGYRRLTFTAFGPDWLTSSSTASSAPARWR